MRENMKEYIKNVLEGIELTIDDIVEIGLGLEDIEQKNSSS